MDKISQKARGLTPEILESILEQQELEKSAQLHAEIYEEDEDLQELT